MLLSMQKGDDMRDISIQELKVRASESLRNVWKRWARYIIWVELIHLGKEISRGWRSDKTSTEILSQMRR
jgi:hypothetical protein